MPTAVIRAMLLLLLALAPAMGPEGALAREGQTAAQPAKKQARAKKARAQPKQSAMVVDANTGRVLHDEEGDAPRYPASLTKMMTLYMLFGEIEAGRATYQTPIRISARAHGMAPSKLGLEVGDEIAAIDAIKALVVKSANDIAVAVAEHIGGSEYQFARMMTERARQIGMTRTTFLNASGLPNPGQLTTARDMLTLALRLQDDYPQHYRLFMTTSFTYRGKVHKTHNTLLTGFPGMDGIKTGYTRASGFNLVSSVQANGKRLVAAVFGGKTAATRNAHMRALLFAAIDKASSERTRPTSQRLVAEARRPAAAPADVAWATETKAPAPVRAAPPPAPKAASRKATPGEIPPPVPAARRARPTIGDVLAEGDTGDAVPTRPATAPQAPPPRLDLEALRAAMAEPQPPAADPAPARAAAAQGPTDIASLIRESIVDGVPPAAPSTTGAVPARAPSTLDSQARTLAAARPVATHDIPPSYLKGPSAGGAPAALPIGAGFEVQVGAFNTAAEAQAKLDSVRGRASTLLDGHGGVTMPVQRDDRQIFRARFVSFDERAAMTACLELRRLAIDCLVMRAE